MLGYISQILPCRKQIGMAVVIAILCNRRAMFWKIAGDELSDNAAEVRGHQHVFQSRHLLFDKFHVHCPQKVGEVHHRPEDMVHRNAKRNRCIWVAVLKGRLDGNTRSGIKLAFSHDSLLSKCPEMAQSKNAPLNGEEARTKFMGSIVNQQT